MITQALKSLSAPWRRFRARRRQDAELAQILRATEEAAARCDRSAREVHGMTVPELTETRARFADLVAREWPDQT